MSIPFTCRLLKNRIDGSTAFALITGYFNKDFTNARNQLIVQTKLIKDLLRVCSGHPSGLSVIRRGFTEGPLNKEKNIDPKKNPLDFALRDHYLFKRLFFLNFQGCCP